MFAGWGGYLHSVAEGAAQVIATTVKDKLSSQERLLKQEQILRTDLCVLKDMLDVVFDDLKSRAKEVKSYKDQRNLYYHIIHDKFTDYSQLNLMYEEEKLRELSRTPGSSRNEIAKLNRQLQEKKGRMKLFHSPDDWEVVDGIDERLAGRCQTLFKEYLKGIIPLEKFIGTLFLDVNISEHQYKEIRKNRFEYEDYVDSFFKWEKSNEDEVLSKVSSLKKETERRIRFVAGAVLKDNIIEIENRNFGRWGIKALNIRGGFDARRAEGCRFKITLYTEDRVFQGECKFLKREENILELSELTKGPFCGNLIEAVVYELASDLLFLENARFVRTAQEGTVNFEAECRTLEDYGFCPPSEGVYENLPFRWTLSREKALLRRAEHSKRILPKEITKIF